MKLAHAMHCQLTALWRALASHSCLQASNILLLLKACYANPQGNLWVPLAESGTDAIQLYSRDDRHGQLVGKAVAEIAVDPADAFGLLRSVKRRGDWDSLFRSSELVVAVHEYNDVQRMVFAGASGDSDLVMLRSWREDKRQRIIAYHSVRTEHLAPKLDGVHRGEIGSSGWVIEPLPKASNDGQCPAAGPSGCRLTYIVTFGAVFVQQMGDTVVNILAGRSRTITTNIECLTKLLGAN